VYRYFNDNGSVQFHSSGEFYAQLTAGAFPLDQEDPETYAEKILSRLDFQGELVSAGAEDNGGQTLTFQQLWNGVPLLGCQATLNYEDGCLVSITSGRRLVGEPEQDNTSAPVTVATALMKFYNGLNTLGDVCSQINTITQAYTLTTTLSEPTPLVPIWYITTDTGAYQLNTLTGELSRTT
jgi:hypothetical protein